MSHNVKITGISVSDFNVLSRAVNELNRDFNLNMQLKVGAEPSRQWMKSSVIQNTVAIITGKDFQYDITLTQDDKGHVSIETEALMISSLRNKFQVPDAVMDVSDGSTVNLQSARYGGDETLGLRAAVGPIIQRYAAILCEDQAARNGMSTHRQVNKSTGEINVVATIH